MQALSPVVYTVAQLTQRVKDRLEDAPGLTDVLVRGELSNNRLQQPSGHLYFTLKDQTSQLKCVMWRSRAAGLRFPLRDGLRLIAFGSLRVYETRGEYQLWVQQLWPDGEGDLHLAYAELKARLEAEGLFAAARKRPLPLHPRCIGVITSPVGAAVRDIIHVVRRRSPGTAILVAPAAVQGPEAPQSLVEALTLMARVPEIEVVIIGRGGGSLEELAAFNDEKLARAIAASAVPVISAVGHETDYTIADFVADVRAATPSAAAELATPDVVQLLVEVDRIMLAIRQAMRRALETREAAVSRLEQSRALDPERRLGRLSQELDEANLRLGEGIRGRAQGARRSLAEEIWPRLVRGGARLTARSLAEVAKLESRLGAAAGAVTAGRRRQLDTAAASLEALSPVKVLARGYAVCRTASGRVVREAASVQQGDPLEITVAVGAIDCRVEATRLAWAPGGRAKGEKPGGETGA